MKSIRVTMVVAVILSITTLLNAQQKEKPSPQKVAERQTNWMAKEINLDENQKVKVGAINLNYATRIADVRTNETNKKLKNQKVKELNNARMEELKSVLTTEQYNILVAKLAEKKEKAKQRKQSQTKQ